MEVSFTLSCKQINTFKHLSYRDQRLAIKSELMIRKKAMLNPTFPSEAVIDEFLKRPVSLPELNLQWKQPNVVKFLVNIFYIVQIFEDNCLCVSFMFTKPALYDKNVAMG